MTIARIAYCIAASLSVLGFPFCLFVYLAASRPGFPGVTEDWGSVALGIPVAVLVASSLSLYLGRNPVPKAAGKGREWLLPMLFGSIMIGLLLLSKFG